MRVRMISNQMSARRDFFHQFRAGARKFSDQEKCRAHCMAVKQFEQARRHCWIRPVVKGESNFSRRGGMRQRWTEQFRRRSYGAPRRNACGSERTRRQNQRNRIQFVTGMSFSHGQLQHTS